MFSDDYDDETRTCEHCGTTYFVDVGMGHTCDAGYQASRNASEIWHRNYQGNGSRVKIQIAIEIDCLNTPDAIETALSGALSEVEFRARENGSDQALQDGDEILDYRYKAAIKRASCAKY